MLRLLGLDWICDLAEKPNISQRGPQQHRMNEWTWESDETGDTPV